MSPTLECQINVSLHLLIFECFSNLPPPLCLRRQAQYQQRLSGGFIVNFENIQHKDISFVDFEHVFGC